MAHRSRSTFALAVAGALAASGAGSPRLARLAVPAARAEAGSTVGPAADGGVPQAPPRVEARATDDRTVSIRWDPSAGAERLAGYEVLLHDRTLATQALEASETGLQPGRVYCYAVLAVDRAGRRSSQSPLACARTPDLAPPAPPASLSVALREPTVAVVSWVRAEDDVGVAGYELVRDGEPVARLAGGETRAVDGGLVPDVEHCWTVRALDAAGNGSPLPAPVCARAPRAGAPAGPPALRAAWGRGRDVELGWEPAGPPGVVYALYGPNGKRIALTARTRFTVSGLGLRGPPCYRVAAIDPEGRESPSSLPACADGGAAADAPAVAPPRTAGP